jgi:hypothetical protein
MRFRTHVINVSLLHSALRPKVPSLVLPHFRCLIPDRAWKSTRTSAEIVRYLSVMAKTCVIKLTPETVHFIVSGSEGGPEGVQIWSWVFDDVNFAAVTNGLVDCSSC